MYEIYKKREKGAQSRELQKTFSNWRKENKVVKMNVKICVDNN